MTAPQTLAVIAAAWCALAVIAGLAIAAGIASAIRHDRFIDSTPSPCERDAQDGRGEGGEGQGAFHSQPIKTILEQDHA